ncbi:hypothetical protein AMATHDRAFT_77856 [Amanita thiersii Skay4041]|uniref:polynucleotide adenylyltransferase n=1 Tax=Amanita thiersii Skay4041 TaxID=703135 RepID=A0A2A9NDZ4_9AGAR|nr:hypothetical protein AMATHDRAFT_77856 [Amanita thiersii Skay4041]
MMRSPPRSGSSKTQRKGEDGELAVQSSTASRTIYDSTDPKSTQPAASTSSGFADDDFIPFGVSEDEESDTEKYTPKKDKGKQREVVDVSPTRSRDKRRAADSEDENRHGHDRRTHDLAYDFNAAYSSRKPRPDAKSRKAPWLDRFDWERCRNVAEMLHQEVKAFVKYIEPTPVEDEMRGLEVTLISRTITLAFPDAKVFPFGSYETKLYLPLGDIDLVVLSESMAYSNRTAVLHAMANALKRAGITQRVSVISKAKVPIVKFITTHTRFNVDISVNQENGVVGGTIINGFLKGMNTNRRNERGSLALRSLVLITKAFLSQRGMNEVYTGGLGSYSIVCLAISFLQMHPKIRRGEIDPDKNLGVLLMDFFELYGCYFNYDEVGISVRDGGYYFKKRQRGWNDHSRGVLLSIEDPTDPSNDISKGSYGFQRVRMTFAGAHGILTSNAYLRAGILNSRHRSRSYRLRDHYEVQDMSILSSILGVTQEAGFFITG